jgi:peptide/nickel transport system substrate-binding protein
MSKKPYFLIVGLLIFAIILVACGSETEEATEVPEVEEPAVEEPAVEEPADEPAEEPAEEPMEEEMAFEPDILAAESCDYGGKISSIEALDELTVQITLCKTDPAFLSKLAFTPFGIQPKEWLEETGGTGELLRHPIGTGPYMIEEWVQGDQVIYKRFDDYWGEPAASETAVIRWNQEAAARLVELQAGNVDFITNVGPDDMEGVEADPDLQLLPQPNPNIFYIGLTNTHAPFDDVLVRQAVAMGIDRQRIVDTFYPPGSEVASHFTPCSIPNGCEGEDWYEFDPEAARELLAEAGFPDGFETSLFYRDVTRVYLPEVSSVAVDIQTQLMENLNIDAEVVPMESGEFIAESQAGNLAGLHMLGWGADYPHVTNFLDNHFTCVGTQFGVADPAYCEAMAEGGQISDVAEAAPFYVEANNAIKELVPMIPVAHGTAAHAALATVDNAYVPPFGAIQMYKMDPGKDTFVVMQNNEPISLFCHDETDGESLRPCQQVIEPMLEYADDSGDVVPELATSCEPSADGLVWTCNLREGVTFHDGSALDANDVVASWAIGLDASSPLHVGNTGAFTWYEYLWDAFINAPPAE